MKLLGSKKLHKTYLSRKKYNLEAFKNLDPITYKHSLNVANYAVHFVKSAGLDFSEPLAYYSGLFHDIGKAQIDVKILNKASPLHKDEFHIIKQHPSIGYNILQKAELPDEILEAVLFHHEQYDGGGYPTGCKADKIPLMARIISICDVFDALTSDRCYRKAYSIDDALQIMISSASQFDPDLLAMFNLKLPEIMYYSEIYGNNGNVNI